MTNQHRPYDYSIRMILTAILIVILAIPGYLLISMMWPRIDAVVFIIIFLLIAIWLPYEKLNISTKK